jgi:F0F1-type ATP synthase beta subunit
MHTHTCIHTDKLRIFISLLFKQVLDHDVRVVLEVAQHLGNNTVRCIAMETSDGLARGMRVADTGLKYTTNFHCLQI